MIEEKLSVLEMAAEIVSAYVGKNLVPPDQLPDLIRQVHGALNTVGSAAPEAPVEKPPPAVPIRRSIQPDHLVCLEDGRKFKSLKRHLRTKYDLTPEQYRAKWGLPKDYPMVAPDYAAARSQLAKTMGLGQGGRKAASPPPKRGARKAKA
jgi:predicted transcriptional regulator